MTDQRRNRLCIEGKDGENGIESCGIFGIKKAIDGRVKNGEEDEEQFIEIDGSVLGMTELIVGVIAIGGMKGLMQTQKAGRVVYEFGEGTREVGERAQELLETVHLAVFDRL